MLDTTTMKKVSINLSVEDITLLRSIAAERHTTMTEAIRGALGTEKFIRDVYAREAQVFIKEKGSTTLREIVLLR
jgi:hypothetical protein